MTSFINDSNQELTVSDEVLFTKQVATFKNFKIKGDVSVSFRVPNNSTTRNVLGYYGHNQIDSPIFTENYFSLVRNGTVVTKGKLVIEQDSGEELSLFFISGNGNWFSFFQFNCREISNDSLQVQANWTSVHESMGLSSTGTVVSEPRTYGIVFPWIDTWAKGQRFDTRYYGGSWKSENGNSDFIIVDSYPALYIHTLVNEISKAANVKIDGTLFDDKFFNTLIITPEDLMIDMRGMSNTFAEDYIKVGMIAPDMKAIDFIKWICISFGCSPVYNIYSKTLYLNLIDKFNKEEAEDWSDYVKSYTIYNDVYQNNYIRLATAPEDVFDSYNIDKIVKYGELNITSAKEDGSENTVYTSPFPPVKDSITDTPVQWATPYIPIFNVEDAEEYEYTSVTVGTDGTARFNGTDLPFTSLSDFIVFRVLDDNGIYTGFHTSYSTDTPSATGINSQCTFISNSTGKLYTQSVSKGNPKARILSFIPRVDVPQITTGINFLIRRGNGFTKANTAYHAKGYSYPILNGHKQGLLYGEVLGVIDNTLQEKYLNSISDAIVNPRIRANMILPDAVFQRFNFDNFVYINTGKINGYFLVESIVNHKDGKTLVEANLYGN